MKWRIKLVFHPVERVADLPSRLDAVEYGRRMHEILDRPAARIEVTEVIEPEVAS